MSAAEPAIVIHSAQGVVIGWNAQAERLFGYRANEIIGQPYAQLVPDDRRPNEPVAERVFVSKDGRACRVIARRSPITDGADGVLAVSEVVTAVHPAEARPELAERGDVPDVATLLKALPQLVWTGALDGTHTAVSERFRVYTGTERDETSWLALVHADDRASFEASLRACRHPCEVATELRLRRNDDVFRWFDVRAVTLGADAPSAMRFLVTGVDIHEARALREQLREEQAILAGIVETLPGVVISYESRPDGDTTIAYVSQGAQALYGFEAAAIRADPRLFLSRLNQDDIASAAEAIAHSLSSGEPWHWEYRYAHPTAGERWLETHFMPGRRTDGQPVMNGVVLDITKRKHDETQLALTEAHLASALDAAQMGAWIYDPETNLVWGNESQRRLWNLPEDTPTWYSAEVGRSRIYPEDLPRIDEVMARGLASGERIETEFRIRRHDQLRWIAMRGRPERGPSDRARRLVGVNIDITQQRLAAESSLRSQKLEALGTLAGGIAHDFNNVLFAIAGNASLAQRAMPNNAPVGAYLGEITVASARASELVRQILAFSRPEEQRLEVLSLVPPVQEALKLARAAIPAMVSIHAELDEDAPPVLADASRIVQVVINLCTNSAHAMGRGQSGLVEVSLKSLVVDDDATLGATRVPKGRYAVLSVSDNGCGMDERTQARIFDPFFTTKAPGEGTGLGLSVVHGIVKALGGIITVYSQPQKGTTFRLYFPAATETAARPAPASLAPQMGRGQRILFVDDELMLVNLGRSLLEALGYRPEAYQDAREALEAFRREPQAFSAVVTDLSMPTLSGFELARALLALRADLPIVLMSGYSGPDERAMAKQLGVRELVLKPVSMSQLGELLARLC